LIGLCRCLSVLFTAALGLVCAHSCPFIGTDERPPALPLGVATGITSDSTVKLFAVPLELAGIECVVKE